MYKRILVPLDGSKLGEQVLPYVVLLGQSLKSRIELLRVFDPSYVPNEAGVSAIYVGRRQAHVGAQAESYLESVAEPLRKEGLSVSSTVCEGIGSASHIVAEADKEPGTLIAMSTHGRSGIGRWIIGSITDKVVQAATSPVLVVRSQEQGVFKPEAKLANIIVPLDGSKVAEQALPHVVTLSKGLGLKVILVRATPSEESYSRYLEYAVGAYEPLSADPDTEAANYLGEIVEKLRQQGIPAVEEMLLQGRPADSILDFAKTTPNSLIAMTTHGRTGMRRWILGSVASRIVRHSKGPVLLLRAARSGSNGAQI